MAKSTDSRLIANRELLISSNEPDAIAQELLTQLQQKSMTIEIIEQTFQAQGYDNIQALKSLIKTRQRKITLDEFAKKIFKTKINFILLCLQNNNTAAAYKIAFMGDCGHYTLKPLIIECVKLDLPQATQLAQAAINHFQFKGYSFPQTHKIAIRSCIETCAMPFNPNATPENYSPVEQVFVTFARVNPQEAKAILGLCALSSIPTEQQFAKDMLTFYHQVNGMELTRHLALRYGTADTIKNVFLEKTDPLNIAEALYKTNYGSEIFHEPPARRSPSLIKLLAHNETLLHKEKQALIVLLKLIDIHAYLIKRELEANRTIGSIKLGLFHSNRDRYTSRLQDFEQLIKLSESTDADSDFFEVVKKHISPRNPLQFRGATTNRYRDVRRKLLESCVLTTTTYDEEENKTVSTIKYTITSTALKEGFKLYKNYRKNKTDPVSHALNTRRITEMRPVTTPQQKIAPQL
jgi:hypothetical protein